MLVVSLLPRSVAPLPETSEAKSVIAAIDIQEPTRKTVRTDKPEPSATVSSTEPFEPTDAFRKMKRKHSTNEER
jgi:hypothetical protein